MYDIHHFSSDYEGSPRTGKKSLAFNSRQGNVSSKNLADALNLDTIAVVDHSESEQSDEIKKGTIFY